MDFQAGDVGYVEKSLLHYVENTGDTDLVFLEMFKSGYYQDISLSEWLSHTPPELVMAHLNVEKVTLDAIPKTEVVLMPEMSPQGGRLQENVMFILAQQDVANVSAVYVPVCGWVLWALPPAISSGGGQALFGFPKKRSRTRSHNGHVGVSGCRDSCSSSRAST